MSIFNVILRFGSRVWKVWRISWRNRSRNFVLCWFFSMLFRQDFVRRWGRWLYCCSRWFLGGLSGFIGCVFFFVRRGRGGFIVIMTSCSWERGWGLTGRVGIFLVFRVLVVRCISLFIARCSRGFQRRSCFWKFSSFLWYLLIPEWYSSYVDGFEDLPYFWEEFDEGEGIGFREFDCKLQMFWIFW